VLDQNDSLVWREHKMVLTWRCLVNAINELISVGYSTSLGVPGRRRNSSVGGPTPDIIGEEERKEENRENKCSGK